MEGLPELGVLAHAIAVAADGDEVAVVDEAIDQRRRDHVIAEDVAPLLEALIRREDRRRRARRGASLTCLAIFGPAEA